MGSSGALPVSDTSLTDFGFERLADVHRIACHPIIRVMPLVLFHPTIQRWFADKFGQPTEPQVQGWPLIHTGRHTLISAPTGTGKTIAGYLSAMDQLARQGSDLRDETAVLYISPL